MTDDVLTEPMYARVRIPVTQGDQTLRVDLCRELPDVYRGKTVKQVFEFLAEGRVDDFNPAPYQGIELLAQQQLKDTISNDRNLMYRLQTKNSGPIGVTVDPATPLQNYLQDGLEQKLVRKITGETYTRPVVDFEVVPRVVGGYCFS